jgi:hypothetical protein
MSAELKNKYRRVARKLDDACTIADAIESIIDGEDEELSEWIEQTFYLLDKYARLRDNTRGVT